MEQKINNIPEVETNSVTRNRNNTMLAEVESRPPLKDWLLRDLEGEIWKDIEDLQDNYSVSNMGRVRGNNRYSSSGNRIKAKILKQNFNKDSAKIQLSLNGVSYSYQVSNLVSDAFLRKKNENKNEVISFRNRDSTDCRASNLEIIERTIISERNYKEGRTPHLENGAHPNKGNKLQLDKFGVFDGNELVARICSTCFLEKNLSEFYEYGGLSCKDCIQRRRGVVDVGRKKRIKELKERGLKKCPKCENIKRLDNEFHKGSSFCKKCINRK